MAGMIPVQASASIERAGIGSTSPTSGRKEISQESKKRKAQDERTPKSRLKRFRGRYSNEYRNLLNGMIGDTVTKTVSCGFESLGESQIGITKWSQREKGAFFEALSRKGKDDLLGIAATIGSKNELEVRVYLELLDRATRGHLIYDRRPQSISVYDAPAALEVSRDCCDALDQAATALDALHEKEERELATAQYGKLGLLNAESALWIEDCLQEDGGGENEALRILPAAKLLSIRSFLTLSTDIFMNSNDPEYNWRSYVSSGESPSISYSAFSDIHELAISITRRLIQSTLFIAMSRIKIMNTSNYTHGQYVRRKDVTAALNVLGLNHDADSYWITVARRCSVDVFEDIRRKSVKGENLSYEEVERRLNRSHKAETKSNATLSQERASSSPTTSVVYGDNPLLSDHHSEGATEATNSSNDSDLSYRSQKSHALTEQRLEEEQDTYAEALDLRDSLKEEQRLWQMVTLEPPGNDRALKAELPRQPKGEREGRDSADDWRSWIDYVAEWETHHTPISTKEITAIGSSLERLG